MVSTQMEIKQMDAAWSLAFLVKNASTRDVQVSFMEPFVGFGVEAVSLSGERLEVVQPGLNLAVRPARRTVSPGATFRLDTPIQIRFDATVPPSGGTDLMMWSIRSLPVAVKLRATLHLGGIDPQLVEGHLDP